jgi:hypothetical protein
MTFFTRWASDSFLSAVLSLRFTYRAAMSNKRVHSERMRTLSVMMQGVSLSGDAQAVSLLRFRVVVV